VEPSGLPASRKHRELGLQETPYNRRSLENEASGTHQESRWGAPHTLADPSSTRPPRALQTGIRGTTLPRESHGRKPNSRPPGKLLGSTLPWESHGKEANRRPPGEQEASRGAPGEHFAMGTPWQRGQQEASRGAPVEHFAMGIPWQRGQQQAFRGTGGLQGSSWGAFCHGNPMAKCPTSRPGMPQLKGGTLKLAFPNTDEHFPSLNA
jgi:hypothetical protein